MEGSPIRVLLVLLLVLFLPIAWSVRTVLANGGQHWSQARWDSTGQAPKPGAYRGAIVQVYAARTYGWKGALAVHSWIAFKKPDAPAYERYEVVAWGVWRGGKAVRRDMRDPDARWAGNEPRIVVELRGDKAAAAIPKIEAAIRDYPYPASYVTWPGPNSNSFVAHIVRSVPELNAEMPANAIGKDFLPGGLAALAPSGTGFQVSLAGVLGFTLARDEGVEVNLLGLVFGLDPLDLAIKLPGVGRIGFR